MGWDDRTTEIDDEWLSPVPVDPGEVTDSVGRYRPCYEIASGGMATVYLAVYEGGLGFEKIVALKRIHPHLAREREFIEMFLDEARIAAHIDHPFVCKVVDFGRGDDSFYLAMEYLLGEPLSGVFIALAGNLKMASSPRRALLVSRIVADLCEGLHAAHELMDGDEPMGVVHRDVNPSNLFVLYDGTVRVVDFGIAKAKNRLHKTEAGKVRGTYAYVAPEQLKLESADRRCDLWSMGIVFWELLTGRRLFKKESPVNTIRAATEEPISPPSSVRPDVPPELDAIVLRALERNPERRYESARALASDIEAFLGSQGETVPRSEVAGWLEELFPGEAERKRLFVDRSRRRVTGQGIRSSRPPAPAEMEGDLALNGAGGEGGGAIGVRSENEPPAEPTVEDVRSPGDAVAQDGRGAADGTVQDVRPAARAGKRASGVPLAIGLLSAVALLGGIVTFGGSSLPASAPGALGGDPDDSPAEPAHVADPPAQTSSVGHPSEERRSARDRRSPASPSRSTGSPPSGASGGDSNLEWRRVAGGGSAEPAAEPSGAPGTSREPTAARPRAAGEGSVYITTRGGWAEVEIAGRSYGRTPQTVHLPAGDHKVVLRPYGGTERRVLDVEVREGRQVVLGVTLPSR